MKPLTPAERLIVGADFKPQPGQGRDWVREQVLNLARLLNQTGVFLKVNSALRSCGYELIDEIHLNGLKVFADLKLCDIPETMETDALLLREAAPELVTVMCVSGVGAMQAVKAILPATEVLGVTVLTSLNEGDSQAMFCCSTANAVCNFAAFAKRAKIDGFICSPVEAEMLRQNFGVAVTINTPAIRPVWSLVGAGDQNPERIMTPAKAIAAGADRIVVGRAIVRASDPLEAVKRTIDEIASVTG